MVDPLTGAGGSAAVTAFLRAYDVAANAHRVTPVGSSGTSVTVDVTGAVSVYGEAKLSTLNSFSQVLGASATATGTYESCSGYEHIKISAEVDQNCTVKIFFSSDGSTESSAPQESISVSGGSPQVNYSIPVGSIYFRIKVTNTDASSGSITINTILARPNTSFTPIVLNSIVPSYAKGMPLLWGFDDGASGFYNGVIASNSSPIPTQIGDNSLDGTAIVRVLPASSATFAGSQYGLATNSRNYGWDGSNWRRQLVDSSGNTVVSGTISSTAGMTTATFDARATLGASTITTGYNTTLYTPSAALRMLTIQNRTNQDLIYSMDNGVSDTLYLPSRSSKEYDFGTNGLQTAGVIKFKHISGSAPTAGTIEASGVRV